MKVSKEKEKKIKNYRWVYPFLVLSFFFISFSVSAFIFMNSSSLVFSSSEEELKALTEKIGEQEGEITELKYQLERYKALYEEELSEDLFSDYENN